MAQQLGEHAQRLVGEILVDEGFLSGQRLRRTARRLIVILSTSRGNFREEFCHSRQAPLPFPFIRGFLGCPKNELTTGSVVAKVKPVQHP